MTTKEQNRGSSRGPKTEIELTDFKDAFGNPIPADYFENEPGPPGEISEEDRAIIQAKAEKIKQALKRG